MCAELAIKRYGSRHRGEPEREWSALTLLADHAPGLAPLPVRANLAGEPPVITMSRLAGEPLAVPLSAAQVTVLAEAVATVQAAVPRRVLMGLPPRAGHPAEFLEEVRARYATPPRPDADPVVRQAFGSAMGWLAHIGPYDLVGAEVRPVFGTGDGNLANYLWDGSQVRFVDFEHSGRSECVFELAEVTEHISVGAAREDVLRAVLERVDPTAEEQRLLGNCRLLHACYWLHSVLHDDPDRPRNPLGTLERQAARVLTLLG